MPINQDALNSHLNDRINVAELKINWIAELYGAAIRDLQSGDRNWSFVERLINATPAGLKREFLESWKATFTP